LPEEVGTVTESAAEFVLVEKENLQEDTETTDESETEEIPTEESQEN